MVLACVDIGSNTTRLLVANVRSDGLQPLINERAFTLLGRSLRSQGRIPDEKIAETAKVVSAQARMAREAGAEEVAAVATAAIRKAANGPELAAAVEDAGAMPLWILSSDEEARLSFAGATRTLPDPPLGTVAVIDVGGGSSELALGTVAEGLSWSTSWEVGSGALADAHLRSDPPTSTELARLRRHVDEVLGGLEPPVADAALAVGGTASSLRRLVGPDLSHDAFQRGLDALLEGPVAETAARLDLDPERVRLLPAGILVLDALAARVGLPLRVARGGLREGVLLELMERRAG